MDNAVRDYIDAHADEFFAALMQWLRIPSISADPARSADVRRSAEWLAGHLRTTGFETAEIWETGTPDQPGLPAVFAQWTATDPAAPTVLIYGHHDVQPVEPLGEWDSPPFEPVELDGQILARGASDDKGQVLFHALGTSAWLAAHGADGPAGHAQADRRGRGGVGLEALRRPACGASANGWPATSSSSPTPPCGPPTCRRCARACAA